jgi:hypothetical protein
MELGALYIEFVLVNAPKALHRICPLSNVFSLPDERNDSIS